jgi:flagellar export protein FliJ
MAAFRFRFASVLRFRERIKEDRRWELHSLERTRQELEAEIAELEKRLRGEADALVREQGQLFSPIDLKLRADYSHQLAAVVKSKRALLAIVREKLAEKRRELIESDREVKTLEQLRRKSEEKFRQEQAKEEQKLSDEVGHRKFSARQQGKKLP